MGWFYSIALPVETDLFAGYAPTERDWYKLAVENKGEIVFRDPYMYENKLYQSLSRTYGEGDEILGVVSVDLTLETIGKVIDNISQGGENLALAITATNKVLTDQSNEENFLKTLADLGGDYSQFMDVEDGVSDTFF